MVKKKQKKKPRIEVRQQQAEQSVCFRFMNRRASANCRYQPTCYEHAANCYTHAVSLLLPADVEVGGRSF